jgi:uncharacterized protein YdeI (YjbR/CyaY-like superfamily)
MPIITPPISEIQFFASPREFRSWLARNHARVSEVWVGFHKRKTGTPSLTWPESVDEALCYGWIDGIRKSIDAERYTIRFTPRKARSTWSAVNVKRVAVLTKEGRMKPAGRKAFEVRDEKRIGIYSYEQRPQALGPAFEKEFRKHPEAWAYYQAQPPWYRRTSAYLVMNAKKEETQQRRLARLIEDSRNQRPIRELTRPVGDKKK